MAWQPQAQAQAQHYKSLFASFSEVKGRLNPPYLFRFYYTLQGIPDLTVESLQCLVIKP